MKKFQCTFDSQNILTSLRDPQDEQWQTDFLLSFGCLSGAENAIVTRSWEEDDEGMLCRIQLENPQKETLHFESLKLQIDANTDYVQEQKITYYQRVMQQACVCGNSSFLYWHRPSGEGRFLAMLSLDDTALVEECNEKPYAVRVAPFSLAQDQKKTLVFRFVWMNHHREIQMLLERFGGAGIAIFPGLVIPEDGKLLIKLNCRQPVHEVCCANTEIQLVSAQGEAPVYQLQFKDYGEKTIHIHYGDHLETTLLCYATRSLEKLIDTSARHIVEKQRYTGPEWYDGLFSQWSMAEKKMTTPDDTLGLPLYCVSADDPGLCKAPYVAEKNISRPDPREIEALEYYIRHFVWGGLQRTDQEQPYPWGVIGSDTWKENRNSSYGFGSGGLGQERMWRTFDYTHLIQLYYNMYRIARAYPQYVKELDAAGYLYRAAQTALAFFEVPYQIEMREPWSFHGYSDWAFKQGNFHELYLLPLMDACEEEAEKPGFTFFDFRHAAQKLRDYWEIKVKYMIYDNPLPYGSEMWFDSTAFESTQAVGHYAVVHGLKPDHNGWYDKNLNGPCKGGWRSHSIISEEKNRDFLERQMAANLSCRGTQMRRYDLQGSDYRRGGFKDYRLSYMSQMGGAAVLDYALYFAQEPAETLRIGYASLLSGWSLVNLGAEDPFYPHPDNEGAVGWAFQPEPHASCWAGFSCKRGPWIFDGEINSGLSGAMYAACSIAAVDPDFGLVCYGAEWQENNGEIRIVPWDGIRRAFHDLRDPSAREHLQLDCDAIREIRLGRQNGEIKVLLENVTDDRHLTRLKWNEKTYSIEMKEKTQWVALKSLAEGVDKA